MKRGLGIFLLLIALALGGVLAVASFLASAFLTERMPLLLTVAALVLAVTVAAVAWPASALVTGHPRGRPLLVLVLVLAAELLALGLVRSTVLRPMELPYTEARETPGGRYWDLPTGSRLAYVYHASAAGPDAMPVVFLHGGPGLPDLITDDVAVALTAAGFDVYAYHQHGAGLSSRAAPAARADEYTVARHVADLEAVRLRIGAERFVVVGHSWGATLAASYAAVHGEHLEKLALTSPGPSWLPAVGLDKIRVLESLSDDDTAKLATLIGPYIPRLALHRVLGRIRPAAAENLIGERAFDAFSETQTRIMARGFTCDPEAASDFNSAGQGYWVNRLVFADLQTVADPRPSWREVDAPVLVLRADCDFVDESVAFDFRDHFPNAELRVIAGAGHEIRLERAEAYVEALLAFLLEGVPRPGV